MVRYSHRVRRSRRFDMFREPTEIPGAPWNDEEINPYVGERWRDTLGTARNRIPLDATGVEVPFTYFQRERTPLMSRRLADGSTWSYPVVSGRNPHAIASWFAGSKNADAARTAASSLIKSNRRRW